MAIAFHALARYTGWEIALLILPSPSSCTVRIAYILARAEDARVHAESLANLHMRTIEALALAIEAKDNTTHDHLRRVQVYAMEVGRNSIWAMTTSKRCEPPLSSTISGNSPYRNTSFPSPVNCRRKNSKR